MMQRTEMTSSAHIELSEIVRQFPGGGGINIDHLLIERGEFIAIMGPSGSGKSTLLNVIGLLDEADSGSMKFNGKPLDALTDAGRDTVRSREIGFVFQQAHVLGAEDALTNAELALRIRGIDPAARRDAARGALAQVGLEHRAGTLARDLSGGERQRLALARVIAAAPGLVLADEPTGSLDSVSGDRVLSMLEDIHRSGSTVVIVTHDDSVAARCHRIIRIRDGEVIADEHRVSQAEVEPVAVAAGLPADEHDAADETLLTGVEPSPRRVPFRERMQSLRETFADALAGVLSAPFRAALLVVAFMLGVGGLVSSIALAETASAQVASRITAAALDDVRVRLPAEAEDAQFRQLWRERAAQLPRVNGVGVAGVLAGGPGLVSRFEGVPSNAPVSMAVLVTDANYLTLQGCSSLGPDLRWMLDDPTSGPIAILTKESAKSLGVSEQPAAGSSIWVAGRLVHVVDVLDQCQRAPHLNNAIFLSSEAAGGLPNVSWELLARTELGAPAAVSDALPKALDPGEPARFRTEVTADLRQLSFGVASDLSATLALLSTILLTLTTVSAGTTMHLSVHARTPEIALRRALGMSRRNVSGIFIAEGALLGLAGGSIGAVCGVITVLICSALNGWEPVSPPWLSPLGPLLGVLTGALAALLPAREAGRRRPAEALRS